AMIASGCGIGDEACASRLPISRNTPPARLPTTINAASRRRRVNTSLAPMLVREPHPFPGVHEPEERLLFVVAQRLRVTPFGRALGADQAGPEIENGPRSAAREGNLTGVLEG